MLAFFSTVAIIVIHTPIWVWALYALLLCVEYQRTRDSAVAFWRVLALPAVVGLLAIWSFIAAGPSALPVVLIGVVIGSAVGVQCERDDASGRLPDGRGRLRGEWWSFAQLVLVWCSATPPTLPRLSTRCSPATQLGTSAPFRFHQPFRHRLSAAAQRGCGCTIPSPATDAPGPDVLQKAVPCTFGRLSTPFLTFTSKSMFVISCHSL